MKAFSLGIRKKRGAIHCAGEEWERSMFGQGGMRESEIEFSTHYIGDVPTIAKQKCIS